MTNATPARGAWLALVASGILGAASGGAGAADLTGAVEASAFEVEEPPPVPVFTWTGFTAGVQVGAVLAHDRAGLRAPVGGETFGQTSFGQTSVGIDPRGVIGGGHVGYDRQTAALLGGRALVLGLEGDLDGASGRGSAFGRLPTGATVATTSDVKGSLRVRAGLPVERVLVYATGGAAFAGFTTRVSATTAPGFDTVDTSSRARAGFTLGGGVDYAFMNDLSLRAEYRYSDYGTVTDQLNLPGPAGGTVTHAETDHRLQAAISYRFGSVASATAHD